ncbi:hypothetical protein DMH08_35665 [Actinomadura sp. WAC 06369]|nr:hypothetical protein DMH08_35665 [Actinomadura sp. WAC 06369]
MQVDALDDLALLDDPRVQDGAVQHHQVAVRPVGPALETLAEQVERRRDVHVPLPGAAGRHRELQQVAAVRQALFFVVRFDDRRVGHVSASGERERVRRPVLPDGSDVTAGRS